MKLSIAIIIFFSSFVALIAEFIVYMMIGLGAAIGGSFGGLAVIAWIFVLLMILTGVAGVLAPVSAIIEQLSKKSGIGNKILVIGLISAFVIYALLSGFGLFTYFATKNTSKNSDSQQAQQPKTEEVKAVLLDKGFEPADYESGSYQDYITFKVAFTNNTKKDIKGFQGVLTMNNMFGDKIKDTTITFEDGIKAGETKNWDGQLEYNQFIDSDKILKSTDFANIKYVWKVVNIVYADSQN